MGTPAIKCVVRGKLMSNDEWRMVFYFMGNGDFNDTLVENWIGELFTPIQATLQSGTTVYGVDVATRLTALPDNDPKGWGASTFFSTPFAFTQSAEGLPPGDCFLVIGRTGVKHVMGKKYIPGPAEPAQANGIVVPAAVTQLEGFAAKWLNPTNAPLSGGPTPAVWGPIHGFTALSSIKVDTNVYHLRRRQQGRGI